MWFMIVHQYILAVSVQNNSGSNEIQKSALNPEIHFEIQKSILKSEIHVKSSGFQNLVRRGAPWRTPRPELVSQARPKTRPERPSFSQIYPKSGPINSRRTLPRWRQERRRRAVADLEI